eukprot:1681069-Prymnesium_polylepis.1
MCGRTTFVARYRRGIGAVSYRRGIGAVSLSACAVSRGWANAGVVSVGTKLVPHTAEWRFAGFAARETVEPVRVRSRLSWSEGKRPTRTFTSERKRRDEKRRHSL